MVYKIVRIFVWAITAIIFGAGAFLGIAAASALFGSGDFIAGFVIGMGLILFGSILAFTLISMFKFISNTYFYSSMVGDYKKRKKRGELDDKY
ncbi:MAG: hypothetical protein FWG34_11440 [Oscillospiraceae bacterium]|nr:hypothetical protein [Oscillospiraceae bacterium]